ncbi:MAG: aminopeptidase P family protein [Mangrovibacterium sp.]
MFRKDTYVHRRTQLKNRVQSGIVLLLGNVDVPWNYRDNVYHWRQDSSFLYYFGLDFQGLAGIVDVDNDTEILFGDDVSMDDLIWMGPQVSLAENAAQIGCQKTAAFKALFSYIEEAKAQKRTIHFLPPYRAENKILLQDLLGIAPAMQTEASSLELVKAVIAQREIKDGDEIAELKKAWNIGYDMHIHAMKSCQEGVWEQTIAGQMEGIALASGCDPSFPIILSQHGETLHNHKHDALLQNGKLMLVDAGAESLMHYASDFTRTSPVGGKFSAQQKAIYEIVLAANNKAASLIKPGLTYQSIHFEACKVLVQGLKAVGIMKGDVDEAVANGAHALFMPHGLGHMMGLDVHDMEDLNQHYVGYDEKTRPSTQFGAASLRLGKELKEGFVLTNEPGLYFIPALIDQWQANGTSADFINFEELKSYRDFGGIRLEDDLLVTAAGGEYLGKRLPIEVDEVEAMIASSKG